jgi:hypothetical protein
MGKVLLAASAYLVAVALLSRGPLGLARIIGPRLHRALDLALVVGLVVSPVIARSDLDVAGVIVAEALAIVLLRLAVRTRYVPAAAPVGKVRAPARAGAVAREPGRSTVSEAGGGVATPAEPVEPPDEPPGAAEPPATTTGGEDGAPADWEEGGDGVPPGAAKPPANTAGGGDGPPPAATKPPATPRPVPTTAWTLGVLAARARRRAGGGSDRALGKGARSLGTALGRANRKRTD